MPERFPYKPHKIKDHSMKVKHLLFLITLVIAMTLGGVCKASAAHAPRPVGQTAEPSGERKDRLTAVVHQQDDHQEARFTDASNLYRICNSRPGRLIPSWNVFSQERADKPSFYYNKFYESFLLNFRGRKRQESAPFHFDVASRYYVICLRHLVC